MNFRKKRKEFSESSIPLWPEGCGILLRFRRGHYGGLRTRSDLFESGADENGMVSHEADFSHRAGSVSLLVLEKGPSIKRHQRKYIAHC